jgi:hypothetical protein
MINFFKKLLGLSTTTEVVKVPTAPYKLEPANEVTAKKPEAQYIPSAKPNTVAKVRAISETGSEAVKAAHAQKSANKKRRPYRGNKNAGGTVAKANQPKPAVTEGSQKGGNNVVKLQQPAKVAKAKPVAPKAPVANKK